MNNRLLGMLGLAMKAGKAAAGGFSAEQSVKKGKSELVIIAGDASDRTKKEFSDMCRFYGTGVLVTETKETLGTALGKEERSVVSVNDRSFAEAIRKIYGEQE